MKLVLVLFRDNIRRVNQKGIKIEVVVTQIKSEPKYLGCGKKCVYR